MKMEPIDWPIEAVLDLHLFRPSEIAPLLDDYFDACRRKGIFAVRLIHGKGQGILKARVEKLLQRHPLVAAFQTAPPEAGGWGATLVTLAPPPNQ